MKRQNAAPNLLPILSTLLVLAATYSAGAEPYTSPIWSIQFSPDSKNLAVGRYQWVQLWDLNTRRGDSRFGASLRRCPMSKILA